MEACFVLLDDCHATAENRTSRLYSHFLREHRSTDPVTLDDMWRQVEHDLAAGHQAVVLGDYEWGAKLLHAGDHALPAQEASALRVLMFRDLSMLSAAEVLEWFAASEQRDVPGPAGVTTMEASVTRTEFDDGIGRVHELIRAGETYQVNYTYRLQGEGFGSPLALYRRLRARQPVAFGALACLPRQSDADVAEWVLSCSPELFLRHQKGRLIARPMKGTAPRDGSPQRDQANAQWLATDEKNRAENLMIVDLLRNDLGRVSRIGSVKVPTLFSIETYTTVHQMTSTVVSEIRPDIDFPSILRALFPCGSITGAPKHHTMHLIAGLESTPRGLYTGVIGWIDAGDGEQRCGDFCMSVAIRTLILGAERDGKRPALLGVGGGIVLDSTNGAEYDESRLKGRFLTELDPGFTLFETLRAEGGKRISRLEGHLDRLHASARLFGFRFDRRSLQHMLENCLASLAAGERRRVRLDLSHDGTARITSSAITALRTQVVKLAIACAPLPSDEAAFVQHKTSMRKTYDAAISEAESSGAFDTLFFNKHSHLTEGARTNVFIRLNGRWWTPPVSCGVLPGVMRARLLSASSFAGERIVSLGELSSAEGLMVCSSLRGILRAEVLKEPVERHSPVHA